MVVAVVSLLSPLTFSVDRISQCRYHCCAQSCFQLNKFPVERIMQSVVSITYMQYGIYSVLYSIKYECSTKRSIDGVIKIARSSRCVPQIADAGSEEGAMLQ